MVKVRLSFAATLVVGLFASATYGGQSWQGAQVMPKSAQVELQADNGSTTSINDISWPATVLRTKGRFLWVQDDGGYSRTQAGGWIYCDDVVRLDEARDHYASELRNGETAWLYWMRGICWESKGEPGIAIADYQNALRIDPNTTLDDVHIRLGRLFAQEQLMNGQGIYNPALRKTWEGHFERARDINPNRPQLYYEWGYALSQACACTQARQTAARKVSPSANPQSLGNTSERKDHGPQMANNEPAADANGHIESLIAEHSANPRRVQLVAMFGIDSEENAPAELPRPATQPKPAPVQKSPANAAPSAPPRSKAARDTSASETITAGVPRGPTPAGSEAAVQALIYYETAEGLSPNWWRLPLARAELMLNQCDEESPRGDRTVISNVKPEFLTQLLDHHKGWKARASEAATPPTNAVAVRGDDSSQDSTASSKPSQAAVTVLPQPTVNVISTAIDDFNRAISLNPNALDAYRDRAEALRLANRLDEAEQSATTACNLCYYRQPRSLRTLAQICNDGKRYEAAADYALRAAELTSGAEQQRFLNLWSVYGKNASSTTAALAVASSRAGFVASRGGGDDDDNGGDSTASKPPAHIEPPPGFFSRSGGAATD
jgi:tetratricopeptide (TPR) repeat protein